MVHDQLTELHHLLTSDIKSGEMTHLYRLTALKTELLYIFGLPEHQGYEDILLEFGKSEPLSDELIDATLITLADEGAHYQTLSKLTQ